MKMKFTRIARVSGRILPVFLFGALISPSHYAVAEDLRDVFILAMQNDAQFRQVVAGNRATQEQKPQAISQLLPNVSLSAGTQNQNTTTSGGFNFGGQAEFDTNTHNYQFSLNQALFRWDRFLQLKQADLNIERSNTQLLSAQHELMLRVSEAYFNVLAAEDGLAFAQAERRSLSRQLEQTNQRFEVGLTAITNVQEAQAGYDRAIASEIVAENNVNNTRESLREIVGNYIMDFAALKSEIPLVRPDPDSIDEWTSTAMEQNLDVLAGVFAVDSARQTVSIQRAGHYPTVDLQASTGYQKSGGGRFGGNKSKSDNVGLQLSVPLYQGGFVNSRVRESVALLDQELERLTQARRSAHSQTRQAYLGVISGISQVQALNQAVISSETALRAVEAGFEVGTRTAVDVIDAERNLFLNRRDYARARYDYLINTLRLKQAAGIISDEDIVSINELLE